jgi:hypothetical protein
VHAIKVADGQSAGRGKLGVAEAAKDPHGVIIAKA